MESIKAEGHESLRHHSRWTDIPTFQLRGSASSLKDPAEFEPWPIADGFFDTTDSGATSDLTAVYGAAVPGGIDLAVRCREPRMDEDHSAPEGVPLWKGDCVGLFLDYRHSHREYLHVMASPSGRIETALVEAAQGNLRWEKRHTTAEAPALECRVEMREGEWWLMVSIPEASMPGRSDSVMGFFVHRARRLDFGRATSLIPFEHNTSHAPTMFADLYLPEAAQGLRVRGVDLGLPSYIGERAATVTIANEPDAARTLKLTVTTYDSTNTEKRGVVEEKIRQRHESSAAVTVAAGATVEARCPYRLATENLYFARIRVAVTEDDGSAVYDGYNNFGFDVGAQIPFVKPDDGGEPVRPDPSDPEFPARMREFIVRSLPRFVRKTTAQGAPSDFVVEAEDESVRFNLMEPGAFSRMAGYIESVFDNDEDRLLGCAYMINQPAFMTYVVRSSVVVAGGMSPLSQLRFGSAQCGGFSTVCLALVRRMRSTSGQLFDGMALNCPGHLMTAVRRGDGHVIIDASIGNIFYTRDNSRLATLDELLADPELARRSEMHAPHYFEHPELVFFSQPVGGEYPENAPHA